jgi:hypothetical protein
MSKGRAKVCLCEPLDRYRRQVWTFIAHLLNCWATTFTGSGAMKRSIGSVNARQ